jgi:hypothetical protein
MSLVLQERPEKKESVNQMSEAEVEFPQSIVHEALKCLRGVA